MNEQWALLAGVWASVAVLISIGNPFFENRTLSRLSLGCLFVAVAMMHVAAFA